MRRAFGTRKVGHAGTLDPLATGVLVVCVGWATRLVPLIHGLPKRYLGRFQLGLTTDTDDIAIAAPAITGASPPSSTCCRSPPSWVVAWRCGTPREPSSAS